MSLLFHRACLQVQYPPCILRLLRRQLLPHLVHVVRVETVVETGPVPVILRVIQDGLYRVRDVDHSSGITRDDKQEPVRSLQYQMFELLVGEE